ncbi:MAG: ATP-NAD kinase [Halobacteriaceae archaeon]
MIAVVGDDALASALDEAGHSAASGEGAVSPACSLVVAVGDEALADVAARAPDSPVLAVATDRTVPSVANDPEAVVTAVEAFRAGEADIVDRTLLSVAVADRQYRALFDAMLVTAEPAQISGFRVGADAHGTLDDVRADGVVAATPAGSRGYARDAGGPTVAPGTDALAVVPIAPFTVDPHRWVVAPPISLTVTRDEGTIELRVDGRERGTVAPEATVHIERDGALSVLAPGRAATMEKT